MDVRDETLTFIHTSDLHIGAPFCGLCSLTDEWKRHIVAAAPQAWMNIVDAAIERSVDFVVIAGDIFDNEKPSYADYLKFCEGLEQLAAAGVAVYLCTGNHDPASMWKKESYTLPANATMLAADKPDFALYERDGRPLAVIGGRGYPNKVWSPHEDIAEGITRAASIRALGSRAAEAPFAVGVLHTGLNLDTVKAPTDPRELLRAGFDYWALGHVHQRWVNNEKAPRIVFSGCAQGRGKRERGARGAYVVELTRKNPPKLTFVPTASVVWECVHVDVSDCTTIPVLVSRVMRRLFAVNGDASCEMMVTRITLFGATSLHNVLGRPGVLEDVRRAINNAYAEFYCDELIDETIHPRDEELLRREGSFASVVLRVSDRIKENNTSEVAYLQEEFLERNIALPKPSSEQELRNLNEQAKNLVLDLLARGDDA